MCALLCTVDLRQGLADAASNRWSSTHALEGFSGDTKNKSVSLACHESMLAPQVLDEGSAGGSFELHLKEDQRDLQHAILAPSVAKPG